MSYLARSSHGSGGPALAERPDGGGRGGRSTSLWTPVRPRGTEPYRWLRAGCRRTDGKVHLSPDSTAAAYTIKAVPEIAAERLVAGILTWRGPDCSQPSDEAGNPVGGLKCLIAVALQMERRLNEAPSRFVSVHGARGCGDQCGALIMFVED